MRPSYTVRYLGPPGWRQIPPVTRATMALAVVGYLLFVFTSAPALLVLTPSSIYPGLQLWRLLTYPIVVGSILTLLFDLVVLWSFGSELEAEWGSRGHALFLLMATLSGGLLGLAATLLVPAGLGGAGLGGVLTAVILAWMLLGPSRPANFFGIFPMTRRAFAIVAIVLVVFSQLEQTHSILLALPGLAFTLGGLPMAWLWVRGRRRFGSVSLRAPRFFRRRRFRVVKDEERFH